MRARTLMATPKRGAAGSPVSGSRVLGDLNLNVQANLSPRQAAAVAQMTDRVQSAANSRAGHFY